MSLVISEAPINGNTEINLNKKKSNMKFKNRSTRKKYEPIIPINMNNNNSRKNVPDSNKITERLRTIHSGSYLEENENDDLYDFEIPENPMSAGGERTKSRENIEKKENFANYYKDIDEDDYEDENEDEDEYKESYNSNHDENTYKKQYYNTYIPSKEGFTLETFKQENNNTTDVDKKLNYVIKMLEDSQDEKTSNVTEEVILYSFLGIFVIFVVDSFVRVGKYVK